MDDATYAQKTFLGHVPKNSGTHRFHPVTRLMAFLCFSCLPLLISIPELNLLITLFHLTLLALAKVRASAFYRFVPVLLMMATFMTVVAIATAASSAPQQTAIFCATDVQTQLMITVNAYLRIVAMFSATLFYFATNTEREFLAAFRIVGLPRVPTYILGLSIRSAALFADDLTSIREAERGRGADKARFALYKRVTKPFAYVIPLFAIGIRRIEEISDALFCRGFTLSKTTEVWTRDPGYIASRYQFRLRDVLVLISLFIILLVTLNVSLLDHALILRNSPTANGWLCHVHF